MPRKLHNYNREKKEKRKTTKRLRHEAKDNLNIKGIKMRHGMVPDRRGWGKIVVQVNVHSETQCLRRRRRTRRRKRRKERYYRKSNEVMKPDGRTNGLANNYNKKVHIIRLN
jgi:hypothetical protein